MGGAGCERHGMKAVCLLSGGLDSAVCAAIAKEEGYELYALSFHYGQRHERETDSAVKIAKSLGVREHKTLKIDLRSIGGSALTDDLDVPDRGSPGDIIESQDIPATYVPARNTIFLSFALAYAEVISADAIFIGAHCLDYSGYPDCRPEYFEKFQDLADLATRRGVEGQRVVIQTPILELNKTQIIREGNRLNVPFELTWSCYRGGAKACGRCDSCVLRLAGFKEAGLVDPLDYEDGIQD